MGLALVALLWFVEALGAGADAGIIALVPGLGVAALLIGLIAAAFRPRRLLLAFLIPFALAEAFLVVAGLVGAQLAGGGGDAIMLGFILIEVSLAIGIAWRARGARVAAVPLALANIVYALWSGFIAGMALTGAWL